MIEREPVPATKRGGMGPARRQRILGLRGAVCARPSCGVTTGLEIDHVIPLELGGSDTDDNLVPLCSPHHKEKTRADRRAIAKLHRQQKMADPKPSTMRSRPFRDFHKPFPTGRGFQRRPDRG